MKTLSDYILEAIKCGYEVQFLPATNEMYKSVYVRVSRGDKHVAGMRTFAEIAAGQIDVLAFTVEGCTHELLRQENA